MHIYKLFKKVFTYCMLLLLSMCDSDSKEQLKGFPTKYQEPKFSLSEIFTDLEVIILSNEKPITTPLDIITNDSLMIIPTWEGKIFRYYYDGTLLDIVDGQGLGPEEYAGIVDLIIQQDTFYINVGMAGREILVYDSNFRYIRKIKYPDDVSFGRLFWHGNAFHLFTRPVGYVPEDDWVSFDLSGNILAAKPFNKSIKAPASATNGSLAILDNNDVIYVYREIVDTIYVIDKDLYYYPAFQINRNYEIDAPLLSNEELAFYSRLGPQNGRRIRKITCLGKLWVVMIENIKKETLFETALFDTEKDKTYLLSSVKPEFGKPFSHGLPFTWVGAGFLYWDFKITINDNEYIACLIDAHKLIDFIHSEEFINSVPERSDIKKMITKLADSIDYDSNPVIFLFKIRSEI